MNSTAVKYLKSFLLWFWYIRNRVFFLNFPIPWRLPYGGWFLLYPDEIGLNLFPLWKRLFTYEEGGWRFIQRFIKSGMICLDIGANQGFYTVLFSKRVDIHGKVYAFEPVTSEFNKLKKNLSLNRCSNIILERMAIGSYKGYADMIICLDGRGSRSSLRMPSKEIKARKKFEKVPITTLDSYVKKNKIQTVDFIKIDVEGSERDVLIGSLQILTKMRPLILIEMADIATKQFGYDAKDNFIYLTNLGFTLFDMTTSGMLLPTKLKETYCENLLAVPNEKLSLI